MGLNREEAPDHGDTEGLRPDTISMTPLNLSQLPYPEDASSSGPLCRPTPGRVLRGRGLGFNPEEATRSR